MEIQRDLGVKVNRAPATNETSAANNAATQAGAASPVQVSDSARQLNDLAKLVHAASDIRTEKVEALKQRVDSGEYQVDLDKLADRLSSEL